MSPLGRMGVRGRLLLAFLAISGFAVAAAGAAMYAFDRAGAVLQQITEERLPPALGSLELSRQAERIVAAAPALLSASTQAEREQTFAAVAEELARMVELLGRLQVGSGETSQLISVRASPLVLGFEGNLDDLDFLIEDRLQLAEQRALLLQRFTTTLRASKRLVGPGGLLIDSALDTWNNDARRSPTGVPSGDSARQLIETLMPLLPQRKAEVVISAINDSFQQIATAGDVADLPVQEVPIERSIAALETVAAAFPSPLQADMERNITAFAGLLGGDQGLLEVRRRELESVRRAEQVLADNAELARQLTATVNQLVATSKEDIRRASADALRIQEISAAILIAVVVMSLLSSGLIAWLYVDRNLVARLRALSDSMLSIAGGDLRAPLPSVRSRDEIGQMGEALAVFRDTAVEVEENNLRDIAQARGRMIDALESTSEGFAFFDAEDRLELSNARYRELLHAGEEMPPGTTFEDILRRSLDRGAVGTEIDPERWIEQRLARHRNPGEPVVQQRGDGRWIMISERRTEGGGIVAVYSDITELKQREAALAAERERLAEVSERLNLALTMDGIGIWDVDMVGDRVWWSPQYTVMMGHDPASYQPSPTAWDEHLHPDEAAEIVAAVDRFLEGGAETLRITQHMLTGDGGDLWTEALMHVQRDPDGRAVRLTGIDVDVTEQRRKERQIEAASVEIARKNQELESLSTKLAKYLSPQVYDSIFSGRQEVKIASGRKKLTVFFSDLVGFTETTDKLESEELTQLLNHYLTEMSRVALDHGATIDKYVGDAIVIFFGDPESRGVQKDAQACVEMAIAMQRRMRELAAVWRNQGIEQPLRCRIGISTGYCTVGNFGSEDRMDYTIIGGGVNLAARLEHAAAPGSILVSYETYALVKDVVHCEARGQIEVKGFAQPVSTYEAIDLHANLDRDSSAIHEQRPHVSLDLDLAAMSAAERQEAAALLQSAMDRLATGGPTPRSS